MAAQSLHHSDSYLGVYYRRMRAKLGAPKAITAAAHKLARIYYHLVTTKQAYDESVFAKNEAREALVIALRKDAHYVEITADNDLSTILSSGYQTASTNRAQSVLEKVQIIGVDNGSSGQLKVRITAYNR